MYDKEDLSNLIPDNLDIFKYLIFQFLFFADYFIFTMIVSGEC